MKLMQKGNRQLKVRDDGDAEKLLCQGYDEINERGETVNLAKCREDMKELARMQKAFDGLKAENDTLRTENEALKAGREAADGKADNDDKGKLKD